MKKFALVFVVAFGFSGHTYTEKIIFESQDVKDIVHLIDGKSYAMGGNMIGLLLKIRQQLKGILFDKENFPFNGKLFSVRELTKLEVAIEKRYHENKQELSGRALKKFEKEYQKTKKELQKTLSIAQDNLIEVTTPFIERIRNVKDHMLLLIEESCLLRGRMDSFTLEWGSTAEGEEVEAFKEKTVSFQKLDLFCLDLINFLEDLINNCPKAWKQFTEMMAEARKQ